MPARKTKFAFDVLEDFVPVAEIGNAPFVINVLPSFPANTISELAAYVHVSTYQAWDEVATWYQGLIKGQVDSSPQIRAAVHEVTRGIADERGRIRALYDYVVGKTRYVGLEFGIHGFQPYRTPQIFARKFGDCKDKASLLVVMLKEAGIPSTMVLARTRTGGDIDSRPASLAPFDHAIVYVPKYDWYLDGTAEFSGADELPASDQDIPVLLVNEKKLVRNSRSLSRASASRTRPSFSTSMMRLPSSPRCRPVDPLRSTKNATATSRRRRSRRM